VNDDAWWDLIHRVEGALGVGDALAAEQHSQALWDACQREGLPPSRDVVAALARAATELSNRAQQQLHQQLDARTAMGQAARATQAYPHR
jgi:hypothetical protein